MNHKTKPYVNYVLIAANIIVFFVAEVTGGTTNTAHMIEIGATYTPLVTQGEFYRLFTAMFLHFGFEHLLGNMVTLFLVGDYLERYLGRLWYAVLYLAGGLFAGWFSWRHEIAIGEDTVSAGASGAIFAAIGGLLVLVAVHRGRLENLTLRRILLMIVFSLYTGFREQGVDGFAHLGGFIAGVVIALILVPAQIKRQQSRSQYQEVHSK